jgi:hypothetical protein
MENFLKKVSLIKVVFIALGLVFGFVSMLTEKEAEYNWVFALLVCAITCAFLEGMRAVSMGPKIKVEENETQEAEKKKAKEPSYDWRNPVLALVATAVSIGICLLL